MSTVVLLLSDPRPEWVPSSFHTLLRTSIGSQPVKIPQAGQRKQERTTVHRAFNLIRIQSERPADAEIVGNSKLNSGGICCIFCRKLKPNNGVRTVQFGIGSDVLEGPVGSRFFFSSLCSETWSSTSFFCRLPISFSLPLSLFIEFSG